MWQSTSGIANRVVKELFPILPCRVKRSIESVSGVALNPIGLPLHCLQISFRLKQEDNSYVRAY